MTDTFDEEIAAYEARAAAMQERLRTRHPLDPVTSAEIEAMADLGWIVGDSDRPVLLADALWMDYGPNKSGKTYRDLELAFCVAFGIPYYGLPTMQGNTLYVIAEGGIQRIVKLRFAALFEKYRAEMTGRGYRDWREALDAGKMDIIASAVNIADWQGKARIGVDKLVEHAIHRPYLAVWLDTWARMLSAAGGHASDSDTIPEAMRGCDFLREKLKCTVVMIAHVGVAANAQERPKGMGEQADNIDGATLVNREGEGSGATYLATATFQRHAELGFRQMFRQGEFGPDRAFIAVDKGDFRESSLTRKEKAVLQILRQNCAPAEANGMYRSTMVDEWRKSVMAAGILRSDAEGERGQRASIRNQWSKALAGLTAKMAIDIDGETVTPRRPI